jgi:transcriptional regulator with XRE-family HTH domain
MPLLVESQDLSLLSSLRKARQAHRISQLELAMRLGVSQRHVSFVESGRAKPSRELLSQWLVALGLSMSEHNRLMLQGGFAPTYQKTSLVAPPLLVAKQAIDHLITAHEPFPCFVLDAHWNILKLNQGGRWLAKTLVPWLDLEGAAKSNVPMNMLDLLCHPEGLTAQMVNLRDVASHLLGIVRIDSQAYPSLMPKLAAFELLLGKKLGRSAPARQSTQPFLTTRFATAYGELSFFSMFTTFGTPQDITLESLKVEHVFGADEFTRKVLQQQALP